MKPFSHNVLYGILFSTIILIFSSSHTLATNGYFSHGTTAIEQSMAGAGTANPTTALSVSSNSASLVEVGDSTDFTLTLFSPDRDYFVNGNPSAPEGTVCGASCPFSIGNGDQSLNSKGTLFLIPSLAISRRINDESAWGLALVARGGMNTEWDGGSALLAPAGVTTKFKGTFGNGSAYSDLKQVSLLGTYSRRLNDHIDFGVSLIFAYQTFEARGLANFAGFSTAPGNVTDQGTDNSTGFGYRIGTLIKITEGLTLGASYEPKISMDKFDKYKGLFANHGEFDLPENFSLGLNWQVDTGNKLLFDWQRINYSGVSSVSNPIAGLVNGSCIPGPFGGTGDACLGAPDGVGFGWKSMDIYKLGYETVLSGNQKLRFGYSQTNQPITESEVVFNIIAPAVVEKHFTLGYSIETEAGAGWDFGLMYAPSHSIAGANTFDPNQSIELKMKQWAFAVAYHY